MEVSEVSEVQRPSYERTETPTSHFRRQSITEIHRTAHTAHTAEAMLLHPLQLPVNATWSLGMCWMTSTLTRCGFAHLFLGQCCRKAKRQNPKCALAVPVSIEGRIGVHWIDKEDSHSQLESPNNHWLCARCFFSIPAVCDELHPLLCADLLCDDSWWIEKSTRNFKLAMTGIANLFACHSISFDLVQKKSMQRLQEVADFARLCSRICWPYFQRFHGIQHKSAHCEKHVSDEVIRNIRLHKLHTTSFTQPDDAKTHLSAL